MKYQNVEDYVINAGSNRNAAVLNTLLNSEPGMKELPDNPTTNGTYSLSNTVEDGASTLTWTSGGGSGGNNALVCRGTLETIDNVTYIVLDKTAAEIMAALPFVYLVLYNKGEGSDGVKFTIESYDLLQMYRSTSREWVDGTFAFSIEFAQGNQSYVFGCSDKDDYPITDY